MIQLIVSTSDAKHRAYIVCNAERWYVDLIIRTDAPQLHTVHIWNFKYDWNVRSHKDVGIQMIWVTLWVGEFVYVCSEENSSENRWQDTLNWFMVLSEQFSASHCATESNYCLPIDNQQQNLDGLRMNIKWFVVWGNYHNCQLLSSLSWKYLQFRCKGTLEWWYCLPLESYFLVS